MAASIKILRWPTCEKKH